MLRIDYQPANAAYARLVKKIGAKELRKAHLSELPRTVRAVRAEAVKELGGKVGLQAKGLRMRYSARVEKRAAAGVVGLYKGAERVSATRYRVDTKGAGVTLKGRGGFRMKVPKGFVIPKSKHSRPLILQRKAGRAVAVLVPVDLKGKTRKIFRAGAAEWLKGHTARVMNRVRRRHGTV